VQKLRIINQSDIALHNLAVVFPEERIEFGDLAGGGQANTGIYRKGSTLMPPTKSKWKGKVTSSR
jgi:hypothetical protein